ncbi:MAG: hypothetical protein QM771_09060 [Nitrospira sp.]
MDIAEKLELLEQRIQDTAEGATMKFSRLLDEGSRSVTQMVDKTKAALDPVHKVDDYPWLMLGGAIFAGYAIGLLEARTRAQRGVYPYYPPGAHASQVMPESEKDGKTASRRADGIYDYYPDPSERGRRTAQRSHSSIWETMSRELEIDTEQAKAALMQAGRTLMTEFANKLIPEIARSLGVTLTSQAKRSRASNEQASYSEAQAGGSTRPSSGSASQFR